MSIWAPDVSFLWGGRERDKKEREKMGRGRNYFRKRRKEGGVGEKEDNYGGGVVWNPSVGGESGYTEGRKGGTAWDWWQPDNTVGGGRVCGEIEAGCIFYREGEKTKKGERT